MMLKAHKYRIYPTDVQQEQMAKAFGCVRFVYNLGLETKIAAWMSAKKYINIFDLSNQMKELKDSEAPWLVDCPSQALQMSMRNLDNAYTNFFKRGTGFPKFKSKHSKQSLQLPQGTKLSDDNTQIFLPKFKWVDIDLHRQVPQGEIKTITVSRTKTNKYFVSIIVDTKQELPSKVKITEQGSVGIDLGVKDFVITSDGEKFENKDFLKSTQRQLRIEQRSLARKVKGSNKYNKQKLVVALLHERVRNQRLDYLHKISKYLIDNYDTICIEDLSVANMTKSCKPKQDEQANYLRNGQSAKSGLNKAILDQGWSEFRSMLEYKAEWYGKNIRVIGRFDPSSKTCSCCGKINRQLKLSDRKWTCEKCEAMHDRDVNAAINIKNFGLRNKPGVSQCEPMGCA